MAFSPGIRSALSSSASGDPRAAVVLSRESLAEAMSSEVPEIQKNRSRFASAREVEVVQDRGFSRRLSIQWEGVGLKGSRVGLGNGARGRGLDVLSGIRTLAKSRGSARVAGSAIRDETIQQSWTRTALWRSAQRAERPTRV